MSFQVGLVHTQREVWQAEEQDRHSQSRRLLGVAMKTAQPVHTFGVLAIVEQQNG